MRMPGLLFAATLLFLPLRLRTAVARVRLKFPPPRGRFNGDTATQFCDGYEAADADAIERTSFPVDSDVPMMLNSGDSRWTARIFLSSVAGATQISDFSELSSAFDGGDGLNCFSIRTRDLSVDGMNATIQIEYDSGDGVLFQCADISFSASVPGVSLAGANCFNATENFSAVGGTATVSVASTASTTGSHSSKADTTPTSLSTTSPPTSQSSHALLTQHATSNTASPAIIASATAATMVFLFILAILGVFFLRRRRRRLEFELGLEDNGSSKSEKEEDTKVRPFHERVTGGGGGFRSSLLVRASPALRPRTPRPVPASPWSSNLPAAISTPATLQSDPGPAQAPSISDSVSVQASALTLPVRQLFIANDPDGGGPVKGPNADARSEFTVASTLVPPARSLNVSSSARSLASNRDIDSEAASVFSVLNARVREMESQEAPVQRPISTNMRRSYLNGR
ncbi:hypothetical protein MKEN_01250000 [Mycena kentingensis (nom. inval.)]|nr:hypothetical protein MKEN_01250000 [Mycena kentingensis (nom. inval.)]